MTENIPINEVKAGMVLANNKGKRYVVIDTELNGNDDYCSYLYVISEGEYIRHKGKEISESELVTLQIIEMTEYHKEYRNCEDRYNITSEKIFKFE